jgi:5-methylthioadenosine/S-adenosylhomocysteine deaminase
MIPIHRKETVVSDLVYSANGQNVDTTIVEGKPLMVNRRFQKLDPEKISESVTSTITSLIPQ